MALFGGIGFWNQIGPNLIVMDNEAKALYFL